MMIKTDSRLRWATALLITNILFIWGNSMLPGEISGAISQWVKDLLHAIFGGGGTPGTSHGLLRKFGHFAEFACLGALLAWLTGMRLSNTLKSVTLSLACGFSVGCIDEGIQNLVPDRGPRFTDVLIDTAGAAVGITLLWIGYTIRKRRKQQKMKENEK